MWLTLIGPLRLQLLLPPPPTEQPKTWMGMRKISLSVSTDSIRILHFSPPIFRPFHRLELYMGVMLDMTN
jgi:hypothetical protein